MTGDELMWMLTNVYNAFTKGRGVKHPILIKVSERVYNEFKDTITANERWVDDGKEHAKALGLPVGDPIIPRLAFKTARMIISDNIPKDSYRIQIMENEDGNSSN